MPKLPKFSMTSDTACTVIVTGNPRNMEPTHVRIKFPGGELEVERASDGPDADYWCHLVVDTPERHERDEGERPGKVTDGRIDVRGKHASGSDVGDLAHPDMYHLAVRVTRQKA